MVAGRVKAAMGFQRSPATPKPGAAASSTSTSSSRKAPAPLQLPGSAAAGQPETPRRRSSGSPAVPPGSGSKGGGGPFSRYFPRSSAQVQPVRATRLPEPPPRPTAADLIRLIEKLRE